MGNNGGWFTRVEVERLCEIAFIAGQHTEAGRIDLRAGSLEDAFKVYESLYKEWVNASSKDADNEELAYISAYANNVLQMRYYKHDPHHVVHLNW